MSATRERATWQGVRRSYPPERAAVDRVHVPYSYYVLGRLSMQVAALFVERGVSANAVTAMNLAVVALALGCVLLGAFTPWGFAAGALLLHVSLVLDNADGHVARFTGRTSRFGALLDDLGGWGHYSLLPICLGVALCFGEPEASLSALGLVVPGWLWVALGGARMFACLVTIAVGIWMAGALGSRHYPDRGVGRPVLLVARGLVEGEALLLLLAAAFGVVGLLHGAYAAFYVATLLGALGVNLRTLRAVDRDESRSAAR